MRRLLLAVAFCLVGFQCLAATLPLGPGSIFPIGDSATGPVTFTPTCSQATTFLNRTSGFTVQQKYNYNNAICALVTSGTFAKLDALYILAAPNQAASLLNLVSTNYSLTVNGTMTFGANAGWMGDGSTGYLATGFIPSSAGGHYAIGNNSLGVGISDPRQNYKSWTAIGSSSSDFADFDSVNVMCLSAGCSNGGNENYFSAAGVAIKSTTPTQANGFWAQSLASSTLTGYFNGASITSGAATQTELPTAQILIAALNVPGVPDVEQFSADTFTYSFFGSGLTPTDITALYNALGAFPIAAAPVQAIANGYPNVTFSYNFASQGLSGIDINGTLQSGFSFYTAYWLGGRTNSFFGSQTPPASSFSFSNGQVTAGNGAGANSTAVLSTQGNTSSAFTATISGTTMSISGVLYGPLLVGQTIVGSASLSGQTIVSCQSPQTPPFTCQISGSATIASPTNLLGNSSASGVAPLFTVGGYYEVQMSYGAATTGTPSFWMQDIQGLYDSNLNTGYGAANAKWSEIDIFEAPSVSDANTLDWTNINGGEGATNLGTFNHVHQAYASITNPTGLHDYGMMWVPSTKNAGTGLIQFYLDRVHATVYGMSDITYTAAGTPTPACAPSNPAGCVFIAESDNFVLLIQSGNAGYPVNLTSVNVWH